MSAANKHDRTMTGDDGDDGVDGRSDGRWDDVGGDGDGDGTVTVTVDDETGR